MGQQAVTMRMMLDEVFKTNFSVFDNYEEAAKLEQIKKLNYIEKIAHQLEKNLTGVNLFDIFPNNNNIIMATEGEINNILCDFNREVYFEKPEEVHEIILLTEEQTKGIDAIYVKQFADRKKRLERNMNSKLDDAASNLNYHHDNLRQASDYREQIKSIQTVSSAPMIDSINKILEDDRFRLEGFHGYSYDNDTVVFKINQDIILTHVNERAGIDLRVNLGRMKIQVRFSNGFKVQVFKDENNVQSSVYYHPHLSRDGDVCLGNMQEMYNEAMETGDIHTMFNAVMAVLTNYNDSDPYRALASFVQVSAQVQPNGSPMTGQLRRQYHTCNECELEQQVSFSPEGESDYTEVNCDDCSNVYEAEFDYDQ